MQSKFISLPNGTVINIATIVSVTLTAAGRSGGNARGDGGAGRPAGGGETAIGEP